MGHRCNYTERIENENGRIVRIVTAHWKEKKTDVLKEYLDEENKKWGRYITFTYCSGYTIVFPQEKLNGYVVEEQDFEEIYWDCNLGGCYKGDFVQDIKMIESIDPSLKYLLKKISIVHPELLFKIIRQYKKYPNIENLVSACQYSLALNNNLQRLTQKKIKQVINFVKKSEFYPDMHLTDIFTCLKFDLKEYKHADLLRKCKNDMNLFNYLVKQNESYFYYLDYLKVAKEVGHNVKEDYWKYPKSLSKAHNKVMEEKNNIETTRNQILTNQFKIVSDKIGKNLKIIDKYKFYIPNSSEDVSNQATVLKQCLITSGYIKKMVEQKTILIFIKNLKDNPIGTIEIDYNKKILQAYGNESDRENCKIPLEIMNSAKEYISSLHIRKHKFSNKKYENLFVKGLYEEDKSFNGMKFEEGKIYSTSTSDEDVKTLGEKCFATDKIFHFCKTDTSVKNWVNNPSSYAIVKVLGALVNKGDAWGSNKIKIEKILDINDVAKISLAYQ